MPPTFTPPTIEVTSLATVSGMHVGGVQVHGKPYRVYAGSADRDENRTIVMALEEAMHKEWAILQQQQAIVKQIAHELKARRKALHG